jgi:hypothetical protein
VARVAARIDRGRYAYLPFDDAEAELLLARLSEGKRYASVHLVRPDGSLRSPNSAPYRFVAGIRHRLGPLVPDGPGPRRYP